MARHAFFVTGDRVLHVANASGAGFMYQAQAHTVLPQVQAGPFHHDSAETVIVVQHGMLELMINGAAGHLAAGAFARIPAGAWFGYRNSSDTPAHILVRTTPPPTVRAKYRINIQLTAA